MPAAIPQTTTALVGVQKSTTAHYFHRVRELIAQAIYVKRPLAREIEANESYFGGRCTRKRERGTAGQIPVFGILKRG